MILQRLFLWSKKLHNWIMWVTILLGAVMGVSGLLLHRERGMEWPTQYLDMVLIRNLHNQWSQLFVLVLGLQGLTGLLMWGIPLLIKKMKAKSL